MANSTHSNAPASNELEIQFILYTSYNPAEQGSYNQVEHGKSIKTTPMYKTLEDHLPGLKDLLTYEELPGMLVMFIPVGWAELTQELERGVPSGSRGSAWNEFLKELQRGSRRTSTE